MKLNCNHPACPLLEIELISLTQGQYAIVDRDDYPELLKHKWYVIKTRDNRYYAARSIRKEKKKYTLYMTRQIMGYTPGLDIDHQNHNILDNRKSNLRICTRNQNNQNQKKTSLSRSSRFKGVSWSKKRNKWYAAITVNNKMINLGRFVDEIEAALIYNKAAQKMFGEFALLNRIKYAKRQSE